MRIAKTVCVTIPPDLLKKAERTAAREHRTMSELVREALRRYMAEAGPAKPATPGDTPASWQASDDSASTVLHSFRMDKPLK